MSMLDAFSELLSQGHSVDEALDVMTEQDEATMMRLPKGMTPDDADAALQGIMPGGMVAGAVGKPLAGAFKRADELIQARLEEIAKSTKTSFSKYKRPQKIPDDIKAMTFYHATTNAEHGEAVAQDGAIHPPSRSSLDTRYGRAFHRPVGDKSYLSSKKEMAATHALGGVLMGSEHHLISDRSPSTHGHIFSIKGSDLTHVQPDEDSVGQQLSNHLDAGHHDHWLVGLANRVLSPNTLRQVKGLGDAGWHSLAGKKLVNGMDDQQKFDMIRGGADIAHGGRVKISGAWKLDRRRSREIHRDASNLFDVAEKIPHAGKVGL